MGKEVTSREFQVVKHSSTEVADKDDKFSVSLKSMSMPDEDTTMTLTIKCEDQGIFQDYPLKEMFTVKIVTEQTKLG